MYSTNQDTLTETDNRTTDEIAGDMLVQLQDAWNQGDGAAFGARYDESATFVNILGELHRGAAIGAGHARIFASTHAGSVNHMKLVGAQRISDDVIVAISRNTLDAPQGPLAGVHDALSTSVLIRTGDDHWRIAATHNTLIGTR